MVDATRTDGRIGGSLSLKLDGVTQACIARGFTGQTWLRLLREALQQDDGSEVAHDKLITAGVDSLFSAICTSSVGSVDDTLIRSYILLCCTLQPSSMLQSQAKSQVNPRQIVFNACLVNAGAALVTSTHASNDMHMSSLDALVGNIVPLLAPTSAKSLNTFAEVILSTAMDAVTGLPSPAVSLSAASEESKASSSPLTTCLKLLHAGIQAEQIALCLLMLQLLQTAVTAHRPHVKHNDDVETLDAVLATLDTLKRQQPMAVPDSTAAPFMTSEQIDGSLIVLGRLRGVLDPVSARRDRVCGTKRKLAEMSAQSDQNVYEDESADIAVLLLDTIQNCRVASQLKMHLRAAFDTRLCIALNTRSDDTNEAGLHTATTFFVRSILHAVQSLNSMQKLRLAGSEDQASQATDRHTSLWVSLFYGALPVAVASALQHDRETTAKVNVDWQSLLPKDSAAGAPTSTIPAVQRLLYEIRDAFDAPGVKPEPVSGNPDIPESLVTQLTAVLTEYPRHAVTAAHATETVVKWCEASDLISLSTFLRLVTQETPRVLDYVFLHVDPAIFLRPICRVLDEWSDHDDFGASQAMELYGSMLVNTMTIVHRHCLQKHVARMSSGFLRGYFTSASATCTSKPFDTLKPAEKALVSSWTSALYGNDGIEDDLIRKTDPRKMTWLSIVILDQSLMALAQGCIDADTLQGGLSYFTQDLLNFCIPGMITHLHLFARGEQAVSDAKTILTVLKTLLLASTTPQLVIDLVSDRVRAMLASPAFAGQESEIVGLPARLTKRHTQTMQPVMPRDIGTIVNLPQQGSTVQIAATLQGLRQAYARLPVTQLIHSLISGYLQTAAASIDGSHESLVNTTFLLTYPLSSDSSQSTLARAFVSEYIPSYLRSIPPAMLDDANASARLDSLADLTAVLQVRTASLGIELPQKRGRDAVSREFWRRVGSWTSVSRT